jgi:drug/metabolite transporter (DMT)-like permease
MKNAFLYITTVLIWGSTWIAIEYQIGEAPVEVSLLFRFSIASFLMLIYCLWKKLPLKFKAIDHAYILLLAIMNFSINYLILYEAQKYLDSAMTSIAFSTLLVINIINTRLFFGTKIKPKVYMGAFIGLIGIVLLFLPTIMAQEFNQTAITGLSLALVGTLVASFGNMVSVRNSKKGLPVLSLNAWGMFYGSITMLAIIWFKGIEITMPTTTSYWVSLSYLSVFGTVIAFASYFKLLSEMGPEKASYIIVLFPVVAILVGIFAENFQLTSFVIAGFLMVLMGNLLVLMPEKKQKPLEPHLTQECLDC